MYKARYFNTDTGASYWRTVFADSVNEATRLAERYVRKGFICSTVFKREGASHD